MKLLPLFAPAILLTSCAVPGPAGYYGYSDDTWYDHAYDHHHSGSSHHRHVRTPFSSKDDERKDADHRTSPDYRDPHHGGSTHGHDAAGHRIDSHGHHVDDAGHHTSSSETSSHGHSSDRSPSSGSPSSSSESGRQESSTSDSSRHETSRSGDSSSSRGENKSEDSGRKGKD